MTIYLVMVNSSGSTFGVDNPEIAFMSKQEAQKYIDDKYTKKNWPAGIHPLKLSGLKRIKPLVK